MPDFLLELFSEEIPARMQPAAAEQLVRLLNDALGALSPALDGCCGPRRVAAFGTVSAQIAASVRTERGPRLAAPQAALEGFLRKHGASPDELHQEGDYWVLSLPTPARPAAALIAAAIPGLLRRFAWPKSMRWGGTSAFSWVRPLRRILCLLDGMVVPFDLRDGEDDGHGLASGACTEGHRFLSPGAFAVHSASDWKGALRAHHVMVDAAERRSVIAAGLDRLAAAKGAAIVADEGLLDEIAGLVEWPVPLLGRIDAAFMDLPPEVMQVSMRANQRYFALRDGAGKAAPYFGFVANIETPDEGRAIIAGNERVLRARFADARHFWDLDRQTRLADQLTLLQGVTFHVKLSSQWDRANRLALLAAKIARAIGADPDLAGRAALLCKADLTTSMVREFPELQGIMGGYYALHSQEDPALAAAIRDHYRPKGPDDSVPTAPVSIAVALADKLDLLAGFFGIGEVPTGSSDPFALRRAALGALRILRERTLRLKLRSLLDYAGENYAAPPDGKAVAGFHADTDAVLGFLAERLRVQLRAEGARHDVLNAVFAASGDDDVVRLLQRSAAVAELLGAAEGRDLLAAYRRAANILRIEEQKDGAPAGHVRSAALIEPTEHTLHAALTAARPSIIAAISAEQDRQAMAQLAALRPAVDGFFTEVLVNAADAALRANRLALLAALRDTMNLVADFSRIEG